MNQSSYVLLCALLVVGCGASAQSGAARTPAHLTTDGDRYAAAIDEAHAAYQAEVMEADAMTFRSDAEADAVAITLGAGRLDVHLEHSLARRGLSMRGLRVYAQHHPGFVTRERSVHLAQLERIDRIVAGLGGHIVYDAAPVDLAPEQLAAR